MNKTVIAFFFSFIFFVSIITPSVLTAIGHSAEISLIESLGGEEEEGKNNKEASKDLESKVYYFNSNASLAFITKKTNSLNYCYKKYNSISKKRILPPPEQVVV